LAHDVGQALGCGGTLSALRRTRVGPWSLAEAHPLSALESLAPGDVAALLRSMVG